MEEEFNRKLNLTDENGLPIVINVIDILDENEFNKEFIIYTLEGDDDTIFASVLNEKEDSYSLDAINNDNEINYVNEYIDKLVEEE